MSYTLDVNASASTTQWIYGGDLWQQPQPFVSFPPTTTIYQGPTGVKHVSKELRVTPSLKGFQVSFTDSHGNTKSSEYSEEELTKALPDLLGKLKKEPKEE